MSGTVVRMGGSNQPSKQQVLNTLHEAMSAIEEDRVDAEKCLLLFLEEGDDGDQFTVRFFNAGLSMSQSIALVECAKARFLAYMNYIPDMG